jgi:lipopolysaccharide exporter
LLARLLTPADYGLFAIALSVQLVGQSVAELGLPAALVRMPESPSAELQAATIGFLLMVTVTAVAVLGLTAFVLVPSLGGTGSVLKVISITLLALPLYAVRAVPMAMMEREMGFGRVAAVEAADTIGFNVFALFAALAGLGVFSLAGAVPFGAMLGMFTAWLIQRSPRMPRFAPARIKPLIGFGSRVSVLGMLNLGRDLGFVTIIGAIGGAPTAGLYAMAKRLFSFPVALTAAVSRVAFPALSRSPEQRPARTARLIGQIACVCGLPLALVAGSIQPLIVVVLGTRWLPTTDIVLFGSLAMMLASSLAPPMNSFFLAEGKPNPPIAAIATELTVGFLLVAALLGPLQETGIGIAMSVGSLFAALILLMAAHPVARAGSMAVVRATAVSLVAAAAGQLLPVPNNAWGLVASLAVVGAIWLLLSAILLRGEVRQVLSMTQGLLPRLRGRGRESA